ncbi:VRR-NUC endonuclease domain-containing protein [Rhizobium phage RHph_X2_26]|nr:VRR-NUC endonuclease domain-containing protein [Rhizobium phage RHph_X2_26]
MARYGSHFAKRRKSAKQDEELRPGQTRRQTTTVGGKRITIVTRMDAAGKVHVKTQDALPLEWELQAAQVSALRKHPAYGTLFALAGDMNAAKRGAKAQMEAKASGMTAGEPDLRLYLATGRLVLIENKSGNNQPSDEQIDRHTLLRKLGFTVYLVNAFDKAEAAEKAMAILEKELEDVECILDGLARHG